MNQAYLLNSLWMWQCRRETRALWRATRNVAAAQQRVLREIIKANRDTEFGRRHKFDRIQNVEDFQRQVPTSVYEDYGIDVDRIAAGDQHVLTAEPVRLLEPTSGTTQAEKLIPYTGGLRQQFQRGVSAWIGDLFYRRPGVRRGRAYWSISPALGCRRTSAGGIPIGFDDDTAYLSTLQRQLVKRLLVVPADIARQRELDAFRYQTLLHLLAARDLALMSIWSPTFLSALLKDLSNWSERLLGDMRRGQGGLPRCAARANELELILSTDLPLGEKLSRIWPRLDTVSCWADAAAAAAVPHARQLLPHATFQPKGLIATEAFVTLPIFGRPGGVLAVRSHFFEFEQVDDVRHGQSQSADHAAAVGSRVYLADQLQQGSFYRVLVTTAGGLYRYHLNDIVEVVGFLNQCPLLRLVGKSNLTSDLVGEKLNEHHVRQAVDRSLNAVGMDVQFSMLVPREGLQSGYCLYLQGVNARRTAELRETLARVLETALRENPYYRHAVEMGQLDPVRICVLDGREPGAAIVLRTMAQRGFRVGDVKPVALDGWPGWSHVFDEFAQPAPANATNA